MSRHAVVLLSIVLVAPLSVMVTGCRQLAPYDRAPAEYYSIQCTADVGLVPDMAPDPDLRLDYLGVGKPSEVPEVVQFDNGDRPVELYRATLTPGTPAPWVAQGTVPPALRGAWLVRLDVADRTVSGPLLRVDLNRPDDIGTVWIGFDTRGGEPDWLQQSFQLADPAAELETTMRTATDDPVRFRLWRLKQDVDRHQTLELGGNADPTAVWPAGTVGAQYLVFIRQKPVPNASGAFVAIGQHRVEKCSEKRLEEVQQSFDGEDLSAELDLWINRNDGWEWAREAGLLSIQAVASSCTLVTQTSNGQEVGKTCSPGVGSQESAVATLNTWRIASTASLDPARSFGSIALNGDGPAGTVLRGRISFATRDDGVLSLDEISLWADDFSSGGLDVAWATFGQTGTVEAACDGQAFPHTLCDGYRIRDGGLELFGTARVGDYVYSATLANEGPVEIEVDLNQREFHFVGGPFEGAVLLEDGSEIEVSAELEVTGQFKNFAPVPLADEGGDRFLCVDNRSGRVRLDARASVDAEGGLASFLWIEDAGLSTQRLLGASDVVDVDLGLGLHDVTLLVEDGDGVRAFTRGTVEVYDDALDTAWFPADAWAVASGRAGGTPVSIGAAGGNDACAGGAAVSDDGPVDRLFPDGLSLVSWTVDDGDGHVARDVQRVLVVPSIAAPPSDAWITSDAMVGVGGVLHVDYGTQPVGHGVVVDEYLLVTAPDGRVWSVDGRGTLSPPGRLVARARGVVRGVAASSGQVAISHLEGLGEEGLAAVEMVLVLRRGNPLDRRQMVGWSGTGWRLLR
jgi:hypothetical protein